MKIQVLVATMNQTDHSLLNKMNIRTDAIIGNQCDRNEIEDFVWNGHKVKYLSFAERGVGLNRNNALMRANADVCLLADDDMVYEDEYEKLVENIFRNNPTADVIVFNLYNTSRIIKKKTNVGYFNFLRYGAVRCAFRFDSVNKNGIYFNQCFGGGTEHCHGEDNLFLHSCLKNGLRIVAVPDYIATLTCERQSTWFNGFNEKYLRDQGVLYRTLSPKWWRLLCLQDAIRMHKSYNMSALESYKLMKNTK